MTSKVLFFLGFLLSAPVFAQPVDPAAEPESDLEFQGPSYPRITTRGQVQVQLDDGARGSARADAPAVLNGIGRFPTDDHIHLRRSRVVTTLHLTPDLEIINQTNFDTRSDQLNVLDMYMRAQLNQQVNMRAGLFKVPFGWEGLRSSSTANTIELSDVTRGISSIRDTGVAFGYENGPWQANLALVQGQVVAWTDPNPQKDVVGKVSYQFSPEWTVGTSFHYGSFQPLGAQEAVPVRRHGIDLQYNEGSWKVDFEYLWSHGYNLTSQADTRAEGFYIAVVKKLDERNDLVLHFDRFEPDLGRSNLTSASNGSNTRNRLVLGWNYYFKRVAPHRLMINYEFANEEEGPKIPNNGFRIRYQYAW